MAGNVKEITDASFEADVLKADVPVLVDFWAPWCGPCKSIAPVLEELGKEYGAKLKIVKINVEDNPRTASQYKVKAIPFLAFFKGGQKVSELVGAVPKDQLVDAINKVV